MNKWLTTALMLVSLQASAVDFSSRTNKDINNEIKTLSLVAGETFKTGFRAEIYMNSIWGVKNAADTVGVNLAAPLLKYEKLSIKVKGGVNEKADGVFYLNAKLGVEIEYKLKANKTFVIEFSDKFDPYTFQRANNPTISTGARFYF